ncbi:pentatricopeptide repeat-containing protein [Pyrus ussuriensis x Pyrus communis]|uniref:Pentatricopeptide repeat-containing protein n=1 Tax=Pyrus ussuriensis x Pyrus communis TaxID=2448454 RepID=A0A5N5FSY3_9ROSA|nr:pentatricopeptide repeat-containing protein [Pyrus ussuriensis x Pyrus communis]
MVALKHSLPAFTRGLEFIKFPHRRSNTRVWKANKRIGTVSKSLKLVESIKGLSNVKEEVYGALDSFIAWELDFPLITVKKALKSLENQKEWKRIIQASKWMLSKGQGRTMGTYFTLLTALAEDGRIEELWTKLFSQYLESMPRMFFDKMISIYYQHGLHDKMFEIFADMEELGVQPNVWIVTKVGNVFKELDMLDKYNKLKKKYPPPKWEYRYIQRKTSDDAAKMLSEGKETVRDSEEMLEPESNPNEHIVEDEEVNRNSDELPEEGETSSDEPSVQS